MFCWLYIFLCTEVRDGICKWVVCDFFSVHVDVTPFIFIYTHTYYNFTIIHYTGSLNKSNGVSHKIVMIEHAIYGLRFWIKFKIVKVAHIPTSQLTPLCLQVVWGGGACSTQLSYETKLAPVGMNFIKNYKIKWYKNFIYLFEFCN